MITATDLVGPLIVIAAAISVRPIVRRMDVLALANPSHMCDRCRADRRTLPLQARALMPGCGNPSCATHPRYAERTRP
ncbi:hypothetical protein [Nonomuraea sp. KM90]|uniref:hypothetical protein n=1 Tax=Nonomuraea sp. KM90 TaxID=3457428 RepID=UPI003FCDC142